MNQHHKAYTMVRSSRNKTRAKQTTAAVAITVAAPTVAIIRPLQAVRPIAPPPTTTQMPANTAVMRHTADIINHTLRIKRLLHRQPHRIRPIAIICHMEQQHIQANRMRRPRTQLRCL